MITTTTTTPTTVTVTKSIPEIRTLPVQYLRAMDTSCFHPITQQRTDCFFDKETGQPSSSSTSKRSQQQQPTTNATTTTTTATTTTVNDHDGTNTNCRHNNVTIQECTLQGDCYRIIWSDGMISNYSLQWVQSTIQQWKGKAEIEPTNKNSYNDRHLWTGFTEEHIRSSSSFMCIPYKDVVSEQNGMFLALQTLYQYGILLVTNTPIQDQGVGIAVLAAALGGGSYQKRNNSTSLLHHYQNPMNISQDNHTDPVSMSIVLPHGTDGPMRTLYGTVWSTNTTGQSAGASIADSAYGQDSLPLHTDLTYYRDPPGLQIFTMIQPSRKDHDGGGGTSIFADGFAAAEILRQQNPDAFTTLTQTIRRYRCIDQMTGWHLEANGPIVQTNVMGQVVQIRHNDLDRMPDLPSSLADNVDDFYRRLDHAHEVWDSVLGRDDIRLQMQLQSGDTMVVANQVSSQTKKNYLILFPLVLFYRINSTRSIVISYFRCVVFCMFGFSIIATTYHPVVTVDSAAFMEEQVFRQVVTHHVPLRAVTYPKTNSILAFENVAFKIYSLRETVLSSNNSFDAGVEKSSTVNQ